MSNCRLCEQEKELIKAHGVPRWAFRYLNSDDQKEQKQNLILVSKDKKVRSPIEGPFDPNILCGECDNHLGKYDGYAKEILLDRTWDPISDLAYLIKNVNLEKLRLFFISVIWRVSISNREEFKNVSMGPYEDRIRQIIIDANNGIINPSLINYSFVIGKYEEGNLPADLVNKHIQLPRTQKINGGINVAVLYMPRGLKIFIKLDQREFTDSFKAAADWQEGLLIGKIGKYEVSKEFINALKIAHDLSRKPK